MPQPKSAPCPDCRGVRLNQVIVTRDAGKVTRVLRCSACSREAPLGICCPKCGDVRFRHCFTRHRGGATIRVKKCRHCGHRVRTRESIESCGA